MWADFVFDCLLSSVSLWADFIVFFVLLLQTAHVGINKAWLRTDDLVPPSRPAEVRPWLSIFQAVEVH